MIKLFRKIRHNLISEGKTGKYLKYALGEIVLVVIGILIALQINTWNNKRIERQIETNILEEILINLEKDVTNLKSKIAYNVDKIRRNTQVYQHLINKTPVTDSLQVSYDLLTGRGTFQPLLVAYENLKSRGVDIIQNDALRIAITELYDFEYYYLTEDLRSDYEPVKTLHMTEVFRKIRSTLVIDEGTPIAEPQDLIALQSDTHFHEALIQAIEFYLWMNDSYEMGIEKNIEVQQKIKAELDNR